MPPEYIKEKIKEFADIFNIRYTTFSYKKRTGKVIFKHIDHEWDGKTTTVEQYPLNIILKTMEKLTQTHNNALKVAVEEVEKCKIEEFAGFENENGLMVIKHNALKMIHKDQAIKNIKEKMI